MICSPFSRQVIISNQELLKVGPNAISRISDIFSQSNRGKFDFRYSIYPTFARRRRRIGKTGERNDAYDGPRSPGLQNDFTLTSECRT